MSTKNEYVQGLAGLVDSVVGAAGSAVDEARKTLDVVDEYITKSAVVLTRVVDVLEDLDAPVEKKSTPLVDYFASWLASNKGFDLKYLKTLDLNAIMDLYNKTVNDNNKSKSWSEFTDDVKTAGKVTKDAPVEEKTLNRDYYIDYLLSKPSMPYTQELLSLLSDDELLQTYNFYSAVYRD